MGYKALVEQHVRHRLENTFGKALAIMIIASANIAANVPVMDLDRNDYLRLVEAVCSDQRVIDLWGVAGAADALREWSRLEA